MTTLLAHMQWRYAAKQYDELFGRHAVVVAGLGYRHPAGPFQQLAKVRKPAHAFCLAAPASSPPF